MGKKIGAAELSLLLIWLVIWTPNLESMPHYFWDEGVNLNYAVNQHGGNSLWFSLKYAYIPHPPLYHLLSSAAFYLLPQSIYSMRILSVVSNLLISLMLYYIADWLTEEKTSTFASFLFLTSPAIVYWGRTAFSNHLLSLLTVASFAFLIHSVKNSSEWARHVASASVGLSPLCGYQGIFTLPFYLFYVLKNTDGRRWPDILLGCLPSVSFFAYMALTSRYFLADARFQFFRFGITSPKPYLLIFCAALLAYAVYLLRLRIKTFLDYEVELLFGNYNNLRLVYLPLSLIVAHIYLARELVSVPNDVRIFEGNTYFILGFAGILYMAKKQRRLYLTYLVPVCISILAFGRSDHMMIPLYPFLVLGAVFYLRVFYEMLSPQLSKKVTAFIVAYPFFMALLNLFLAFNMGLYLNVQPLADMSEVAAFTNARPPDGLVLTLSYMVPYFRNASIITQSAVYETGQASYYPPSDRSRFVQNLSVENAAYVVATDSALFSLTDSAPEVVDEVYSWKVVDQAGIYKVWENPGLEKTT